MSTIDEYADWDAAYVLGALPADQRREYEHHLAECDACRAAVTELAGMPGLLAQLPPGEVLAMDLDGGSDLHPPASLMPVLPTSHDAVADRRRRRWLVPVAAAAAALLIGGVGGYAASSAGRDGSPDPGITSTAGGAGTRPVAAPGRLAFTAVEPSLMTAVVDVVPIANGTELRVECQYARQTGGATSTGSPTSRPTGGGDGSGGDYRIDYAIWVVDRSGKATELRDWTARPDRIMHPVGVSALPVAQIASVEIRQVNTGHTVMRANLT
ncbi:Putative zinc-finger [Pedococcus dokdonensis]|uniref:Putative zinc-finger n=1 Tax=Pedococcus dokdonensis TaxID=443156 RepID=A0A1H0SET5_9MICO|nr:zf-HC2 domain-containing protein [Pedococcus dokdonensis]SDP39738.1 Putative zinc-finger [Pedococcus dokdonensis]